MKKLKKLFAGILALALALTLLPVNTQSADAATKYAVTQRTSVAAEKAYTYKITGVKKSQYVKVAVTGAAKAGVTVTKGSATITTAKKIKGTGSTLKIKVTADKSVAQSTYTLKVKIYNKKTNKLVKTVKAKNVSITGGMFKLMTKSETAVTDSKWTPDEDYTFYLYKPSYYHNFDMMSGQLNPVIMVYPNEAYTSSDEAYEALEDAGIIDIAENNAAFIVVPNPLNGSTYTEDDVNLFYESQVYLAGGKIVSYTPPTGEYERYTFNNMLYCIGEGAGSTFINNYLTQNANRIAAVLTFGGEMDSSVSSGVALPAYLVNATSKAVSYYKDVNDTDTSSGGKYVNSSYEEKQVIVKDGGDTFDADVIKTAWNDLLGGITRAPLAADVVANTFDESEWVLMTWPNYEALGISVVAGTYTYEGESKIMYDYVPSSYTGDEAVPLVVLLHGFTEDPLCPAATCGWAKKAAEEGFIVVAPDYTNDILQTGVAVPNILQVVSEAKERYNIDTTKIYLTGFSMGGMNTFLTAYQNAEIFAAVAPMSGVADFTAFTMSDSTAYDLPTFFLAGTIDDKNAVTTDDGYTAFTAMAGKNMFEAVASFNEISIASSADYSINPFGYKASKSYSETYQGYVYDINKYYNSTYTNPVMELVAVNGVAHACSNVYADLAWDFMSHFSRNEDGSISEE